jgi:6-phosphofructokinase 1
LQRGGAPSAFDRYLATMLGYSAVQEILAAPSEQAPRLIGIRGHRITYVPLMDCVQQTDAIAKVIAAHDYDKAMELRGGSFKEAFRTMRTLVRALPHPPEPNQKRLRLAIMHGGAPASGMNTAVRAAVRLGIDKGHFLLGVRNGIQGLINGDISELDWSSVNGWASRGGAELETSRKVSTEADLPGIAEQLTAHNIQGILMIGGWVGYQVAAQLYQARDRFAAFNIPIVCLPATIDNNLPGSELSIGADTALNNIVEVVDKIKQSAVASHRCFVVEVMGRYCGYLALMSGLATGAEQVYLHEKGVKLADLQADLAQLTAGFSRGKRLGLIIRNEKANDFYTTDFMCSLFEEEGGGLFDVRQAILGHLQQGGDPSPFDRIQATRLARHCIEFLETAEPDAPAGMCIGLQGGQVQFTSLDELPNLVDPQFQRPLSQWWLELQQIAHIMAHPGIDPVD